MSRNYDNWEKLVGAVLRKEKDRQLAYCESLSSSCSDDLSSCFSLDPHLQYDSGQKFDHADLSSQSIFLSRDHVMAMEFEEIRKATRNFRPSSMLEGGLLRCVYKGWIDEHYAAALPGFGIAVAVNILSNPTNLNFLQDEFINHLSQLRHPNLLTPIGYSFQTDKRILVYEFMPKGSLSNHLFRGWQQPLFWATRIKVAVDVARGLSFLHGLEIPFIFRIFKSDNIMLDADFNAKLSGIGLPRDLSRHKVEGPLGIINEVGDGYGPYAAPEYITTGHLSTECDVYSFGVVLVELITGLRALDINRHAGQYKLMDWVKPYLGNRRRFSRIMDNRLDGQYRPKEAYNVAKLALQCTSSNPLSRPRMAEVVAALQIPTESAYNLVKAYSAVQKKQRRVITHHMF